MKLRPWIASAVFMALFIAAHTLVLLGSFEGIDPDEQFMGNLAKDLREGLLHPLLWYRQEPRELGGLPFALFAVPFLAAFGQSVFALKLAAIAFTGLCFLPWVDVARRLGGARTGLSMAVLAILPFPTLLHETLDARNVATHLGTCGFSGLAAWFLCRGRFAGAGFAIGAGFAWALSFWPVGLALGAIALVMGRTRRSLVALAAGALVWSPIVWITFLSPQLETSGPLPLGRLLLERGERHDEWPDERYPTPDDTEEDPDEEDEIRRTGPRIEEAARVLTVVLPRLAGFGYFDPRGGWLSAAYAVVFAACAIWLALKRDRAFLLFGAAIPVHLAVYVAAGYYGELDEVHGLRYFLPIAPFLTLIAARCVPPAICLAIGVLHAGVVFQGHDFPTAYRHVSAVAPGVNIDAPGAREGVARALETPGRSDYPLLAFTHGVYFGIQSSTTAATDAAVKLDDALDPDFWRGVGAGMSLASSSGRPFDAAFVRSFLERPRDDRDALFDGIGTSRLHWHVSRRARPIGEVLGPLFDELAPRGEPDLRLQLEAAFLIGAGRSNDRLAREAVTGASERELQDAALDGFARSFAAQLRLDAHWPEDQPLPRTMPTGPRTGAAMRAFAERELERFRMIRARFLRAAPIAPR